jgi:DNA transformation protein
MNAKQNTEFHDFVIQDVLANIPGVTSRAMFGGYGIYKDGKIFAIIAERRLYFKVGEDNRADYERAGSKPFTYTRPNGKPYEMSYWELPEEVMENREELPHWVEKALAQDVKKKLTAKRKQ